MIWKLWKASMWNYCFQSQEWTMMLNYCTMSRFKSKTFQIFKCANNSNYFMEKDIDHLADYCLKHKTMPCVKQYTGSAQKMNLVCNISLPFSCCIPDAWQHLNFFTLRKAHTLSLSAVVVTSLSACNPSHPLSAAQYDQSVLLLVSGQPKGTRLVFKVIFSLGLLTYNVQTSGIFTSFAHSSDSVISKMVLSQYCLE